MTAPKIADLISPHDGQISPHSTLGKAATLMLEKGTSSLIVVDGLSAVGIVTEGDMLHAMREHRDPTQPVSTVMTSPVHSVPGSMEFREAYREAVRQGIRHIVVTDDHGRAIGVASESEFRHHLGPDFFRHLNDVDTLMDRMFPRLPPEALLDTALSTMEATRAGCVVVVENRCPVGILTERDVVRLFRETIDNPPLATIMTRPVVSIRDKRSLAAAAEMMSAHGIRHLVAVDSHGHAVGLLAEHTLMRPLELDLVDEALSERVSLLQSRDSAIARTLRNERYQRALLDNFPFLVWLKDTESRFLAVNRSFAEAVGERSGDALIGKADHTYFPAELADRYKEDDRQVMQTRLKRSVLEPIFIHDQAVWHETYKAPVIGDDGELLGTVGFAYDISNKKRSEEAMLLRNAALAGLARGEPVVGVLELIALSVEAEMQDWQCAILLANEAGTQLHCAAAPRLPEAYPAAVEGMPIINGGGPCGSAAALCQQVIVEDIFSDPATANHHGLARLGGFVACCAEPILGPQGELFGTFVAYHASPARPRDADIALLTQASQLTGLVIAHQRTAAKLESSLETFRGIFDSVDEALIVLDENRLFLDVNLGAERMSGHPRNALIGHRYNEFGAQGLNDPQRIDDLISAAFSGTPQTFEYWACSANGRIFPVEVRLYPGAYFGRSVLIAAILDITERKNTELRLEVEHDLAHALASGMQRETFLATLLQATLRFHEFDAGMIYWHHPDDEIELLAHAGLSPDFVSRNTSIKSGSWQFELAKAGRMACNCTPDCGDCHESPLIDQAALAAEGLSCLAVLPIVAGDRTLACLYLGGRRSAQISPTTLSTLEALAHYFSHSLLRLLAHEEGQRLQQNLSGLFDALNDFIFIVDRQGLILHHNRAVTQYLGYPAGSLLGRPADLVRPENMRPRAAEILREILAGQRSACTLPLLAANGRSIPVETRFVGGYWNAQPVTIGVAQDISERLIAEERQKLAASVFDNAHEGIMITDPLGRIIEVNATFSELTGYSRAEAVGQNADLLKSGHHEAAFYDAMWQTIRAAGYWRGEVWNRKKSGEIFVELLTISTVRNREGEISNFVGIFSDITLIKEHQQRLEHLAHFDALTQLPNRMLLGDRMQLAMAQSERNGKALAVCYLDLDDFKPVNDLYGHAVGDRLLIEVAQRLKTCIRAGDTVSRLGGDEFVLLFSELADVHECDYAISRVITMLTHPFPISGHSILISASIGVTLYPQDGSDCDTLLRHADQAMYAAKQSGRNRYHLFDPENDRRARARREEIERIREGLGKGEFVLHYQPKVNMRRGTVIGAEALIRWQHPELGLLLPGQFLPAIEGNEVSIELGDWVIREALRQLECWAAQGLELGVSINIAGNHLQNPGFTRRLGELLASHPSIPPQRLELEILETAALEDIALAAELFAKCRKLGVSFALDDFGTGYSSLTYFRRLPADVLKIDQSFIRDMLDDPDDLAIVEGVIGLTQAFQREVIAEGVESVEHGLVLLVLGCDVAQGYGIARPMPAGQLPDWVGNFRPNELWSSATAFRWSREDLPMLIAEVEHSRWKNLLYAFLEDESGRISPPPDNDHGCRFGRWYYSPASQRYAHLDGFVALEDTHSRIHQIGHALMLLRAQRENKGMDDLKAELETCSTSLSQAIQQIQAEMLITPRNQRH